MKTLFDLFEHYHNAVWPMPIVMFVLGLTVIYLALNHEKDQSTLISIILGFFWFWNGVIFFTIFAAPFLETRTYDTVSILFPIQGLLFFGAASGRILKPAGGNRKSFYSVLGLGIAFFAMVIYPIIGNAFGHYYPSAPIFGEPCPITIFTFGIMLASHKQIPWYFLAIPLLWSILGIYAFLRLGVYADISETIVGIVSTILILVRNKNLLRSTELS